MGLKDASGVGGLFAEVAQKGDGAAVVDGCEPGLYRLVVCDTFRVPAPCDADDLFRHDELLLLHDLEVAYHVHSRLRSYQCKLVKLMLQYHSGKDHHF